jgi:hypothetical protein
MQRTTDNRQDADIPAGQIFRFTAIQKQKRPKAISPASEEYLRDREINQRKSL